MLSRAPSPNSQIRNSYNTNGIVWRYGNYTGSDGRPVFQSLTCVENISRPTFGR